MRHFNFDYPLPPTAVELLLVLVDTAEQYQLKTVTCREVQLYSQPAPIFDEGMLPHPKDPLGSLQKVGLIERLNKGAVRLRANAFKRARYERQNWMGKWWVKMWHR